VNDYPNRPGEWSGDGQEPGSGQPYGQPSGQPYGQPWAQQPDQQSWSGGYTGPPSWDPSAGSQPGWQPPPGPPQGWQVTGYPPPPSRPPRRGLVIGAIAVVAALAISGGTYAVVAAKKGSPAANNAALKHLPADTIAVAAANLDPGSEETVAALKYLRKFPSIASRSSGDSLTDGVLRPLIDRSPGVDFDRDIKPWLGKHAAIAADPQGGSIRPVLVVEVTDETKAKATLEKDAKKGDVGYIVKDGWATISDAQRHAQTAFDDAAKSNLSGAFSTATRKLPADAVITSMIKVRSAIQWAQRTSPDELNISAGDLAKVPTTLVASLRFGDSAADVQMRASGGAKTTGPSVGNDVAALPADSSVAVGVTGLDVAVRKASKVLGKMRPGLVPLPPFGIPGLPSEVLPTDQRRLLPALRQLPTVVGSKTVFAADGSAKSFGMVATTDPARAAGAAREIAAALDIRRLAIRQTSTGIVVATSAAYASTLANPSGAGTLGSQSQFKAAVGDTDRSTFVAYVDVHRLAARSDRGNDPDARALKAIGVNASSDGGDTVLHLRVVTS